MSYATISLISQDVDLKMRLTACASVSKIPNPWDWVNQHIWDFASQPEWSDKYASALASENPSDRPGWEEDVITDGDILAALQVIRAEEEGTTNKEVTE